eukprot:124806_1
MSYFILFLSVLAITNAFKTLKVLSNIQVGTDGGRYTQIKIGKDGLPLMVYNDEKYGCARAAHCEDIYCKNITSLCIDSTSNANNARFIFLKMHCSTGLPILTYTDQTSTNSTLKYVSCLTPTCNKYNLTELYSPNNTFSNNIQISQSAFDFNKLNNNYTFISFTVENIGLHVIECLNNDCSKNKGPLKITEGVTGGYFVSVSIYYYYNYVNYNSFDAFNTFWDKTGYLGFSIFNAEYELFEFGAIDDEQIHGNGDNVGQYNFMIQTPANNNTFAYSVMWNMIYVDSTNGTLKYANCSINARKNNFQCNYNILDNIGINAYGVFPEMDYYETFNKDGPIMSYIDQTNNVTSKLKILQCNNMQCDEPNIQ